MNEQMDRLMNGLMGIRINGSIGLMDEDMD
jgi:hypothetical protein